MKTTPVHILLSFCGVVFLSNPDFAQSSCTQQPDFVQQLNFDLSRSGFSTSDKLHMGLIFAEFSDPRNPGAYTKIYQHPSWKMAGYLGVIVFDEEGNIYVAPLPVVNSMNNPVNEKNTIFKIDHETGVMEKFVSLPVECSYNPQNPFGIVGMTYDCDLQTLFVSTLEGSDYKNELGKIFSVSLTDKKTKLILDRTDALGLATFTLNGKKNLYYGSARASKIFSLNITDSNSTKLAPESVLDFSNQGPRGDDKARKIKIVNGDGMQIFGVEFDYNLVAPTAKQENVYYYQRNASTGEWVLKQ